MIEYPHYFEGQTTAEGAPLYAMFPDVVVREAEPMLATGSTVLDVGAGSGTNGTYLALQGHKVHSVELNPDHLEHAQRIIRAFGGLATANTMVQGDMRNLNFREEFDAVIATRTLQLITKSEAYQVVRTLRQATKPGGLNILNTYIAKPDQQAEMPDFALFEPFEMETLYKAAGWEVISEDPNEIRELTYDSGKPGCSSKALLIARKPNVTEQIRRSLIDQAEACRRSDPERYCDLMDEAAAL